MKKYILLLAGVVAYHTHIVGMELSLETVDKFMPHLFKAIENKNNDEVKRMVAQNPTIVNAYHHYELGKFLHTEATALHVAVYTSNVSCVQFLLESGAGSNAVVKESPELRPLHLTRDRKIAELLIQHGAPVDQRDKYGDTPLYLALFERVTYEDVADLLIAKGADIDQRIGGWKNRTLLHEAAWEGRGGIVKFLLQHKANRALRDNQGKTPLDLAELRHITFIVEMLKQ